MSWGTDWCCNFAPLLICWWWRQNCEMLWDVVALRTTLRHSPAPDTRSRSSEVPNVEKLSDGSRLWYEYLNINHMYPLHLYLFDHLMFSSVYQRAILVAINPYQCTIAHPLNFINFQYKLFRCKNHIRLQVCIMFISIPLKLINNYLFPTNTISYNLYCIVSKNISFKYNCK